MLKLLLTPERFWKNIFTYVTRVETGLSETDLLTYMLYHFINKPPATSTLIYVVSNSQ